MELQISRKNKIILMFLLLLLNIIIRIPSIPHEKGYDSFLIHSLANSISIFGESRWWINWLSVFGLYPYSYASAVPFTLSGIAQTTGVEMEKTILVYCIILGIFSMFTSYLMAENICNNFIFKYIMTLSLSISPGLMTFTTWEVSTRGQFMVFFPLFIYLLLKKIDYIKKIALLLICFILVFATHHYAYFLIPLAVVFLVFKTFERIKIPFYFKESYKRYIFLFALFILIIYPFFSRSLMESGSRYGWIISALITNTRYVGPLIIFGVGGLTYLLFKNTKFEEVFMLSVFVLFLPTLYSLTYGPFLMALFIIFLTSVGFNNLISASSRNKNKLLAIIIIFMLFSFVAFSSFYNHFRTGQSKSFWYIPEGTYHAGIWSREHVPDNSRGLNMGFETGRFFAISEGHPITPSIGAGNLAYGFINESYIKYDINSPFEKQYYFEGPYSVKSGTTFSGRIEWLRQKGRRLSDLKGFDYFIEDKYEHKPIVNVIHSEANRIYDSTRISVWKINQVI